MMAKVLFFKIEFRIEDFYYGDGVVRFHNNEFEGYIALDYICGIHANSSLYITLLERIIETPENCRTNFVAQLEDFELPNSFVLYNDEENLEAIINFKEKVQISNEKFEARLDEVKVFLHKN